MATGRLRSDGGLHRFADTFGHRRQAVLIQQRCGRLAHVASVPLLVGRVGPRSVFTLMAVQDSDQPDDDLDKLVAGKLSRMLHRSPPFLAGYVFVRMYMARSGPASIARPANQLLDGSARRTFLPGRAPGAPLRR